jgi:hypothetical protein
MAIKSHITDFRPGREKFSTKIRLVSGGFSIRQWFPTGEITVLPWDSAMDEWAVKARQDTPVQFVADAVKRLTRLGECPVGRLVYGDATTILLVARALRNRGSYVHHPKCASCGHTHPEDLVTIPDDLEKIGFKADGYLGTDSFTLPDCGDEVTTRPLLLDDIFKIGQRKLVETATVPNERAELLWSIVAIGGGKPDSIDEVNQWYEALSPADQQTYLIQRNELDPHLSQEVKYTCDNCKAEFSCGIQLNSDFFRRRIGGSPVRALASEMAASDKNS